MLIIVEGPDGSGKSTLVDAIARRLRNETPTTRVDVLASGPPRTSSLLAEYLLPLADYTPGTGHHVICDRWHVGELVYPGLTGRAPLDAAHPHRWWYLDAFLASRGALVVLTDARRGAIDRRLADRDACGETVLAYERVAERQFTLFDRAHAQTSLEVQSVFIDDDARHRDNVTGILGHARGREVRVAGSLALPRTYVGWPFPEVLLLGDARSTSGRRYPTAFATTPGSSGDYLLGALDLRVNDTARVGLVNVNEEVERDDATRQALRGLVPERARVVALGRDAFRTARAVFTDRVVGAAPHPQYVRRFHHTARAAYGVHLWSIIESGEDGLTWRP